MDFQRPLQVVTPTLDGDVLAVLARGDAALSGRHVHRLVGHSSEGGVRRVLERLTEQGIVLSRPAGRANLYELNRDHLAAEYVEGLAGLRRQLVHRLRESVSGWRVRPLLAVLFGSVARGEARADSDLDLLVVRPEGCDPDSSIWRTQIDELAAFATSWTGNRARVLEYGAAEFDRGVEEGARVLAEALEEGIELEGALEPLRVRTRTPS